MSQLNFSVVAARRKVLHNARGDLSPHFRPKSKFRRWLLAEMSSGFIRTAMAEATGRHKEEHVSISSIKKNRFALQQMPWPMNSERQKTDDVGEVGIVPKISIEFLGAR